MAASTKTLRLHVWGANPTLPTLDPTSLYAASLLLATFGSNESVKLQLTSASTSLSIRVPLLQVIETGPQDEPGSSTSEATTMTTELLDDIDAIRVFCVAAGLDADLAQAPETAARVLALHAMLDDQLLDLTLHSLFSLPANYSSVTAPSYSSTGSNSQSDVASSSFRIPFTGSAIPSRLRSAVQQRLTAVGIWGVGGTESAAQAQESHDLANRAGLAPTTKSKLSFGPAAKDAVKDEFEKSKLARKIIDLLAVLESSAQAPDSALLSGDATSSLDAHVFSVLAPLLYSTPALPVQLLSMETMSRSFPKLLARLSTLRDRLWPADRSTWPTWASTLDLAASTPTLSSASTPALSSWWPFASTRTQPQQQEAAEKASTRQRASARFTRPRTSSNSPEDSRLRWGRILWITSAVVALVGYTFASGIVSVQWVDNDAENEGEKEAMDEDEGVPDDQGPDADPSAQEEQEEEWETQDPAEDLAVDEEDEFDNDDDDD